MRALSILYGAMALSLGAEDASNLFQKALTLERAQGDPAAAIRLYQRIVDEYPANRKASAQALLQLGGCHERLGRHSEARKAYEKLVSRFSDQSESSGARTRLAELGQTPSANETVARRMWSNPGVRRGGISPDGRFLAHTDDETGDLAVRNLASGESRRLTNKGAWTASGDYADAPVFSPDGRQIAYCWFVHHQDRHGLRISEIDGASPPRIILQSDEVYFLEPAAWARDQKEILAVIQRTEGTAQIAWIALNGRMRVLKSIPGWRYPGRVRLSPDGRFIAYSVRQKEDASESDIFLLSADGSREIPLIEHPADDSSPVWTPDGRRVIFSSNRTGSRSLWAVEVTAGKPHGAPMIVRADGANSSPIGFSIDGSLYYSVDKSMSHVFVAELDPKTGKLVTRPTTVAERYVGSNFLPAWLRDRTHP